MQRAHAGHDESHVAYTHLLELRGNRSNQSGHSGGALVRLIDSDQEKFRLLRRTALVVLFEQLLEHGKMATLLRVSRHLDTHLEADVAGASGCWRFELVPFPLGDLREHAVENESSGLVGVGGFFIDDDGDLLARMRGVEPGHQIHQPRQQRGLADTDGPLDQHRPYRQRRFQLTKFAMPPVKQLRRFRPVERLRGSRYL